jgi:hypothetical protein
MPRESVSPKAFYAYPSKPEHLAETIEIAIKGINKRHVCDMRSWIDLKATGRIVINAILNRIDEADLVVCDLTGLNPNVLFEFGYAVAKKKRVWVTVDHTNPEHSSQVQKLAILSEIGFKTHENYDDIINAFFKDNPYLNIPKHVLADYEGILSGYSSSDPTNDVFYLPSPVSSTASKQLTRFLKDLRRRTVIDDHLENSYEPLTWYLTNILSSRFVIVHLQNEERTDHLLHNALYAFLAGIARGFSRSLIMLVPAPFEPPFDYRGLLQVHRTAEHCVRVVRDWLVPELARGKDRRPSQKAIDKQIAFLRFHIGESTAENEEIELQNYFITTGAFKFGMDSKLGVFIGRKGTGKTANLYRIRDHFAAESMNLTITVKPVSFKLETFSYLIKEVFTRHDMAVDFIERVWRVVIYSEIAATLQKRLAGKPSYYDFSTVEEGFLDYCKANQDFINSDFADKIDLIHSLTKQTMAEGKHPKEVLGIISRNYVEPLLTVFSVVFRKFQQIVILVDNLDKAWEIQREVGVQASIIFGLLGFQNTIRRDLAWAEGDVRLLIFLREDIFRYVIGNAREPDKIRLSTFRISWESGPLLIRLLEERFLQSDESLLRVDIWEQLFCSTVYGKPVREFLTEHVLPRPRDLIHIVKNAIALCVNRNGDRLDEDDLLEAHRTYFQFLLDNLVTEYGLYFAQIKDMILAFMNSPSPISLRDIYKIGKAFGIPRKQQIVFLEFLIDISFLGIKDNGKISFSYSSEQSETIAKKVARIRGILSQFKPMFYIHPAFHGGLGVTSEQKTVKRV